MHEIENNPLRIIGVVGNATEKEIQRQKVKISRYSSVGKQIDIPFDNIFDEKIERSESLVNKAFSDIEKREDRLKHSIFWFVNLSSFDEIAINHIKNGNKYKALEILKRISNEKCVIPATISCVSNLATLQMMLTDIDSIKKGISNKITVIQSKYFEEFVIKITDETITINKNDILSFFISVIISNYKAYDNKYILSLFEYCDDNILSIVSKKLSEEYIKNIEMFIKEARCHCDENNDDGYIYAKSLGNKSRVSLNELRRFIDVNNDLYKNISNEVAIVMMKLDVLHFNYNQNKKGIESKSLEILNLASTFATSNKTKLSLSNDIKDMESRISKARISKYYDAVYEEFENFKDGFVNIDSVNMGISKSKPKFDDLKRIDGSSDDYLQTSSITVSILLGAIIKECNKVQENNSSLAVIKSVFQKSVNAMCKLADFDMDTDIRSRFNKNLSAIKNMNREVQLKKEGCYIATMAYGDYDHPQVVILREFRDNVLMKTIIGRLFVRKYYKYSPLLVNKLKHSRKINKFVRLCLDVFIKRLKK